jgi:hypothetical protein
VPPRYRIIPIPQARMLVQHDVRTGETWHASMKAPDAWEKIADGPIIEPSQDDPPSDPPLSGLSERSEE